MSKSKGNAVDPFDALETFGADAIPLEPDWLVENWRNEIKKMSELSKI